MDDVESVRTDGPLDPEVVIAVDGTVRHAQEVVAGRRVDATAQIVGD